MMTWISNLGSKCESRLRLPWLGSWALLKGQLPKKADAWKVRLESGNVFEFPTQNLQDMAAPAPAAAAPPAAPAAAAPAPAMAAAPAKAGDDDLEFEPGQQVRVLAPPAMAGKLGSIEGPTSAKDTWKVRLESGMVFEFQTQNLQDVKEAFSQLVATPPVAPATAAAPAKAGQA